MYFFMPFYLFLGVIIRFIVAIPKGKVNNKMGYMGILKRAAPIGPVIIAR